MAIDDNLEFSQEQIVEFLSKIDEKFSFPQAEALIPSKSKHLVEFFGQQIGMRTNINGEGIIKESVKAPFKNLYEAKRIITSALNYAEKFKDF